MDLRFSLNDPNRERSSVSARFKYNKRRLKFSTGVTVPTALWLADNSGVKISPQITAKHGMNPMTAQNVNDTLAKIKRQFAMAWNEELKKEAFDIERVKAAAINSQHARTEDSKPLTSIICDYIAFAQKHPIGRGGTPASPNTLKTYRTSLKRIEDFERDTKVKLSATDIHRGFYNEFLDYMTEREYKIGYASKIMDPVKRALRWAHESGIQIHDDVLFNRLQKYHSHSYLHPTISIEELKLLADMELKGTLEKTRDLLIVGCWTALRISDLMKINRVKVHRDEDGEYIQVESTKVEGTYIEVPLHPQVQAIRKRWNGWPPVFNEQDFNRRLKKLGKLAGMTEKMYGEVMQKKIVNGESAMRTVKGNFQKWELIASHCCRRSFATNMYGILPIGDIMQVTGHSSESTFRKYIHMKPIETRKRIRAAINEL